MVDDVHMIIPPFLATSASYRQYPCRLIWVGPTHHSNFICTSKALFPGQHVRVNFLWFGSERLLGKCPALEARLDNLKLGQEKKKSSFQAVMLNLSFFWLSCLSSKKKKSRAEVTLHERSPCLIFEGKHDTEPWPRYTSKQQTKGARIHLLLTPPPRLAGFHGRDRRPLPPHRVMSLVS